MSSTDLRRIDAASSAFPRPAPPADAAVRHAALLDRHAVGLDDFQTGRALSMWGGFALVASACCTTTVLADLTPAMELGVAATGLLAVAAVRGLSRAYFDRCVAHWNASIADAVEKNATSR